MLPARGANTPVMKNYAMFMGGTKNLKEIMNHVCHNLPLFLLFCIFNLQQNIGIIKPFTPMVLHVSLHHKIVFRILLVYHLCILNTYLNTIYS